MLFLHHPPFDTGIRHMDVQRLHNAEELLAVVSGRLGVGVEGVPWGGHIRRLAGLRIVPRTLRRGIGGAVAKGWRVRCGPQAGG